MRRPFAVLLTGLVALAGFPPSARGHAILLQATPAPNATVEGPDLKVALKFNSRIDAKRSRITILMPDQSAKVLTNDASSAPDTLTAQGHGFAPGAYRLKWQVLSSDGHITRGEHPFTVK
jgi:methionine-rich copper-binding protein CopC